MGEKEEGISTSKRTTFNEALRHHLIYFSTNWISMSVIVKRI